MSFTKHQVRNSFLVDKVHTDQNQGAAAGTVRDFQKGAAQVCFVSSFQGVSLFACNHLALLCDKTVYLTRQK